MLHCILCRGFCTLVLFIVVEIRSYLCTSYRHLLLCAKGTAHLMTDVVGSGCCGGVRRGGVRMWRVCWERVWPRKTELPLPTGRPKSVTVVCTVDRKLGSSTTSIYTCTSKRYKHASWCFYKTWLHARATNRAQYQWNPSNIDTEGPEESVL